MKKLHMILLAMVLAILTACGNGETEQPPADNNQTSENEQANEVEVTEDEQEEASAFPVTFTDAAGKEITIEEKPENIVSLVPSNTEILYALGATAVGVSENDNYPEEVLDVEKVAGMELDVEKIVSLDPDLVLAHGMVANMWESGLQQLEDSDITVVVIHNATGFDETYDTIAMIGQAVGANEEAEQLIEEMKSSLESIKEKASEISDDDKKTVFIELGPAPDLFTSGKGTYMDEMLEVINAENVVTEENDWIQISEEQVLELNPDAIVLTYNFIENAPEEVYAREAWQDITAVKEKQVYEVNEDLVSRQGPRVVEGVEELAKAIYPEVFGE